MRRLSRHRPRLAWLTLAPAVAIVLYTPARAARVQEFADAALFFELNDTDGDLGLHAEVDGEPWTTLTISTPGNAALLDIVSRQQLNTQGMTQLAFESAEPSFDELAPAAFFQRFPEGVYRMAATTGDGGRLESEVTLSQVMAAPPGNIRLSGVAAAADCDVRPLPLIPPPVIIDWDPVTQSHPEIGRRGPVTISRYQLFVEGGAGALAIDVPPTITAVEVPAGVTAAADEFKFEIIARTTSGNNTAVESCFRVQRAGCSGPPPTPAGLNGRVSDGVASIHWSAAAGATRYIGQAGSSQGAANLFNGDLGNTTNVTAPGLPAGFRAWVRIIAVNACGQSAPTADLLLQ